MEAWKKGEFGSPFANGAPPKINALRLFCQSVAPKVVEEFTRIALYSENEALRIQAGKYLLDQSYGKAPQSMEIKVTEGLSPSMMSSEQIKMFAAGKVRELIFSMIQSGQIEQYTQAYQENLTTLGKETEKASGDENKQLEVKG